MESFECNICKELETIEQGVWVNNGGSWSMVIICRSCYEERKNMIRKRENNLG